MLKVKDSGQFKKDYKRCVKRGLNMNLLKSVVATLAIPTTLPIKNQDHDLKGNYKGFKECHIAPNWLLIYRYKGEYLELSRTGTHSDLFDEQGAIKIFANVIRKILKDCEDEGKKVTQVELANVLGISRQAFTNKLTRDSFFIDDVVKIANYLGMQVILKGSNEYVIEKED